VKNYRGIKSFDNFSLSAERVDGWLSLTDPRYPGGDAFEIVDCLAVSLSATCNEKTGKVGRTGISRRQGYFLCGSAQLFNREALCQALQIERAKAVQLCDIDLVLESFVQWGVDSFRRLAGNFPVRYGIKERRFFSRLLITLVCIHSTTASSKENILVFESAPECNTVG